MRRKADFSTKSLEEKEAALIKRQQVKKGVKLDQVNSKKCKSLIWNSDLCFFCDRGERKLMETPTDQPTSQT